jgi:hypothetical protein
VDFAQSKIHRRKAKTVLFSCGKYEKLRFSAGDHRSPLQPQNGNEVF